MGRGGGKGESCEHCVAAFGWGRPPASVVVLVLLLLLLLLVLNVVEVFVGGDGHAGDEQHHLAEADLRVSVGIEVLHDLVNGGLVSHVLRRKGQGEGKVLSLTAVPQPLWDPHGCQVPCSVVLRVAPAPCHHHPLLWVQQWFTHGDDAVGEHHCKDTVNMETHEGSSVLSATNLSFRVLG